MTDKKYTNEDIISSLKIIATTRNCNECKIRNCKWGTCNCEQITANAALDLFNRLQAENERLKSCVKTEEEVREIAKRTMEPLVKEITREQIDIAVKLSKSEAYKEFADLSIKRICEQVSAPTPSESYIVERCNQEIDNLLKEKVGDSNDTANKGDRL